MRISSGTRAAAFIVTALLGAGLSSCGDGGSDSSASSTTHTYPAPVTKAFAKTCVATAQASSDGKLSAAQATEYCRVSLACVERKLTLDRFEKASRRMIDGDANPDAKTFNACAKESVKDIK